VGKRHSTPKNSNAIAIKAVGADKAGGRVFFSEGDHLHETLGKEPVIGKNDLAVLALRRNLPSGMIVILNDGKKIRVVVNADPRVPVSITLRDFQCLISAAIVNDSVVPVLIGLGEYTLDALGQVFFAVVNRRDDTDERLMPGIERPGVKTEKLMKRHGLEIRQSLVL
jgi:hypothetical protein